MFILCVYSCKIFYQFAFPGACLVAILISFPFFWSCPLHSTDNLHLSTKYLVWDWGEVFYTFIRIGVIYTGAMVTCLYYFLKWALFSPSLFKNNTVQNEMLTNKWEHFALHQQLELAAADSGVKLWQTVCQRPNMYSKL